MRDRVPLRFSLPAIALATAIVATAVPASALATISTVAPVEGPSPDVVEVGGAAMAEDGTGGIVYLRKEGGRNHVFAVQFSGGAWGHPQRVDTGQDFDSSWPRIAAGVGGRLLVTWVQEFGVGIDRLFSATLDPGAKGFQEPVPVDFNVGEATATHPDLTMNAGGQAYLTYLAITDESPLNPPGYLGINVRVARYNDRLWSVLGNPMDRNPATPMPEPTAVSGPRVGIDSLGQAVVAWREPDDEFVNRVWARRVFGTTFGVPLQISPSSWEGAALRGEADAFDLDDAGFGQTAVAFRQLPGQGSKLAEPRIFVNEMPDAFAENASAFHGARLADGGPRGEVGPPSVAVEPEGGFLTGFAAGPATLLGAGDNSEIGQTVRADGSGSSIAGEPLVDLAESGADVAVWKELRGSGGNVAVREKGADGVVEPGTLSAPGGGAIGGLAMAGSGLGDAIVVWRQGSEAKAQIAAAVVDAPPNPFLIQVPEGWKRKAVLPVSWEEAENAIGVLRYSVSVDDEPVGKRTSRLRTLIRSKRIGDGRHRVQVFAIDEAGQETGSRKAVLLVDRKPPRVKLRRRGRAVAVLVFDGGRASAGFKRGAIAITFGDRDRGPSSASRAARRSPNGRKQRPVVLRHTFSARGRYRIVVKARDRAGNRTTYTRVVSVR